MDQLPSARVFLRGSINYDGIGTENRYSVETLQDQTTGSVAGLLILVF
jgi:hypothetical protein